MQASVPRQAAHKFSSISFSGAGFLLCYHLGVQQSFLQHGFLLPKGKMGHIIPLTGVSGGALAAAAIAAGVDPEDSMELALQVNRQTSKAGVFDSLQPGFSLIDVAFEKASRLMKEAVDYDSEFLLKRIDQGRLLRIGLTDRRVWPFGPNSKAYVHVERYRDIDDVVAACILSSYIPVATGPALGSLDSRHSAVAQSSTRLNEMIRAGYVVNTSTGLPVRVDVEPTIPELPTFIANLVEAYWPAEMRELCWDGGLVDGFPQFDDSTLMVSPVAADFGENPSITPANDYKEDTKVPSVPLDERVRIHLTAANAVTFRRLLISSDDATLETVFRQGFDNANEFLKQNNLLTVYTV